jgi:serine phosphatase RsbU (regulator of sigma subunit)
MSPEPKVNILLVDDSRNNLVALKAMLEDMDLNLVTAQSGVEALRRLLAEDFALILLDVQMPGMDGFETAEVIRGRDRSRHAPIIFLTAFDRTEVQLFRGYSVGAVDFLSKPIVPEILRSKVPVFVELFRQSEQLRRQAEQIRENERQELERQLAEERRRVESEGMQATLRLAQQVQRNFFPAALPSCSGFDICGLSYPAEATGGDYFDYFPFPDRTIAIAIGDVCGHGFGPALLMAATRAYLRALVLTHTRVGDILDLASQALSADLIDGRFVTLILARLDPDSRSFVYASAGHTTGYVLAPGGEVKAELPSTGLPLGIMPAATIPEAPAMTLEGGELILLLTDGIVEATDPERRAFGTGRALDVVRAHRAGTACEIVTALHRSVCDFARSDSLPDDVTSLVIKVDQALGPKDGH